MKTIKNSNIDLLRIIAIFLVILLHTSAVYFLQFHKYWSISLFYDNISRISVPIFFIISGYLLLSKEESISTFFIKRASKIILPFVAWSLFYIFIDLGTWNTKRLLSIIRSPTYYHLWFIYAMMFMYFLTPMLRVINKNPDRNLSRYMICLWFIYASVYVFACDLRAIIDPSFDNSFGNVETYISLSGFFIIGGYLRNYNLKISTLKLLLIIMLCMSANFFATHFISTFVGSPNEILFKYFSPFVAISSISAFVLLMRIQINIKPQALFLIEKMSELSFGVYLIHAAFLPLAFRIISPSTDSIYSMITIPVITMTVFIASYIASAIISRIPYIRRCI